ncbi:MAG: response regulator [Balneola sp.]
MRVLRAISLTILLITSVQVFAYQPTRVPFNWDDISNQYQIRNYSIKDGLPINSANQIIHHTDGFLYIATNDGLAKFDGDRFVVFDTNSDPTMQSNRISWLESGVNDELWFADVNGNLYMLQYGEIVWFQKEEGFKDVDVLKLDVIVDGSVIITTSKGLYLQKEGVEFVRFSDKNTRAEIKNSFSVDGARLDFITENGWFYVRDEKVTKVMGAESLLIPVEDVFKMKITKDEARWLLGYKNQLLKVDGNNNQELYTYDNESPIVLWDFIEMNEKELLVDTKEGYLSFNREMGVFNELPQKTNLENYFEGIDWQQLQLSETILEFQNTIYIEGKEALTTLRGVVYLASDKEEGFWVATNGDGIYHITKKKMITIGEEEIPGLINVYGLHESNNNIWTSSFENNIFKISEKNATNWNRSNSELAYTFFRSVFVDENETIMAGNFDLWEYHNQQWSRNTTFRNDGNLVDVIFRDSKQRVWIGTSKDLYKFNGSSYVPFEDNSGERLEGIRSIKELKSGELAISTAGLGLVILGTDTLFRYINKEQGLSSNLIRDFYESSNDTAWVVSEDRGLNRIVHYQYRDIKKIEYVLASDGLIDNSLHTLIDDKSGYFWINSNSGIMRISQRNINKYLDGESSKLLIQSFSEKEGLDNIEGNGGVQNAGLLTEDGKLLFPNQAGLVYTRPEWHMRNNEAGFPKPIFETISFSDSVSNIINVSEINFPREVRNIQVKFTLPTFTETRNLELEYKLEGVNDNWENANQERIAVFTNIPSGDNRLIVRGKLKGSEEYTEASMLINVKPYFYETGWFLVLSLCFLGGVFYLGYKALLKRAKFREMKLEELVNDRTKELLEEKEKTVEALQIIKKLDESKSQFFTNFTHELRTPLSLILSPLEEMLENNSIQTNGNKAPLSLMMRSANRLKSLVNQLLDVSKLSSGEINLTFQEVDIVEITKRISAQFEYAFEKQGIKFSIESTNQSNFVFLDVSAWEHICTNLLGNSLKFTPDGGNVFVRINNEDDFVKVVFEDSGSGIAKADLPFIFDPYYQGDSSIEKSGGTGIGLAIVKGMIEKMGGEIHVHSVKNEGAIFNVTVKKGKGHISENHQIVSEPYINIDEKKPVLIDANISDELIENKSISETAPKVLLVEDNEDFRTYLKSLISRHYNVKVASNGKLGLEALKDFHPDIILSDVMMPEMDGFEMMNTIRQIDSYKHIPFIFLSAKDSEYDVQKGLNMGADIYLTKPVQNKLLLAQIKVLLRRERMLKASGEKLEQTVKNSFTTRTTDIIKRHLGNPDLNIDLIAEALSMSSASLYRKWKNENDETINQIINKFRFEEALKLIKEEGLNISEASYAVGFTNLSYFSRAFKKMYGLPPQEYLNKKSEKI